MPHSGEVLAWGIETATGRALHIRELPRSRTGAACGMECVGCGRPLLAFNAGALTWKHRPHFYHPSGTSREDCHIIASRMAAIERLMRDGVITLPARRKSGCWEGISGTQYEAWRQLSEETVQLKSVSYSDRTRALVTLADGRQFVVMLRGEFARAGADSLSGSESGLARLVIEAGPNAHLLSEMDPDQLRECLTLLPSDMAWECHWADGALVRDAQQDALAQARAVLDALPAGMDPARIQGDTPQQRRESLLHELVREIVSSAGFIDVPGWRFAPDPYDIRQEPAVPNHRLELSEIRVERRLAARIPDVQCKAVASLPALSLDLLAIEVVVYSDVDEAKLQELRDAGAAVLSLNLRNWGGRLTWDELRTITLTSPECKHWLHHPLKAAQFAELEGMRARARAWAAWHRHEPQPNKRSRPAAPSSEDAEFEEELLRLGSRYRETALGYLCLLPHPINAVTSSELMQLAEQRSDIWVELSWIADELRELGAPGGVDADLIAALPRLLSIREDRGIGQAPSQNARATINHLWSEIKKRDSSDPKKSPRPSPFAALECLAYRVFEIEGRHKPPNRPGEQVASRIRASLEALEPRFEWDRLYLPVIMAVFPEMRPGIERLARRMDAVTAQRGRVARAALASGSKPLDRPWSDFAGSEGEGLEELGEMWRQAG